MDHTLTRAESLRLMELLSLPMEQYGNFPLMRKAFLQKCKILHPDKGGNQELAKELISLYKRLEELLPTLNPEEGFSTTQVYESSDIFIYLSDWSTCRYGKNGDCRCLFCLLQRNHKRRKTPWPKVWGDCFCFKCYTTWFGLHRSWMVFLSWKEIIGKTPYRVLNI
ncbi:small T antigen [Rhinolophus hildebrandtii polyomavirus 1]|uniref:small T antigen n=1 Tax=Rhinolophus hildebrandtii polyomavirus 1 TaxID=1904410 RepID=UPI0009A4AEF1|nr:small T antigen [Rhinolophus hildebrandtii polyomavirus 1]BAX01889.1 small T antigen [Rhinolophus hildebrandtii polyomavirus 1]